MFRSNGSAPTPASIHQDLFSELHGRSWQCAAWCQTSLLQKKCKKTRCVVASCTSGDKCIWGLFQENDLSRWLENDSYSAPKTAPDLIRSDLIPQPTRLVDACNCSTELFNFWCPCLLGRAERTREPDLKNVTKLKTSDMVYGECSMLV